MQIRRSEHVVVQTSDYNQWNHQIEVGLSHLDLGWSDEDLVGMNEEAWEETFTNLKQRVDKEIQDDIVAFFHRVAKVSDNENVATVYLSQHQQPSSRKLRRS